MNPVDHVSCRCLRFGPGNYANYVCSPTVVVTTSISVKHRQSRVTLYKVKRPVSLLRGEQVCYVVLKRRRIRDRSLRGVILFVTFSSGRWDACSITLAAMLASFIIAKPNKDLLRLNTSRASIPMAASFSHKYAACSYPQEKCAHMAYRTWSCNFHSRALDLKVPVAYREEPQFRSNVPGE